MIPKENGGEERLSGSGKALEMQRSAYNMSDNSQLNTHLPADEKRRNGQTERQSNRVACLAYLGTKRCFDIVFSLIATVLLAIPVAVLCMVIMCKDFGNPFYVHQRVGKGGKIFRMLKLRSMRMGADDLNSMLSPKQLEEYRKEYKIDDDPRLIGWGKTGDCTRCFGAFLRRLSLDEIPQIFWNILIKGNMSLVGPRPILCEEMEANYTAEEQKLLTSVKPGLTGYWQAYARNNATYKTGERQRMELYYVHNQSLWLDLKIMFATVGAVLRKYGAK